MSDEVKPAAASPEYQTAHIPEKGRRDSAALEGINANINARISNPLKGLTREELFKRVDELVDSQGMQEDRELLKKGALVAQDPENYKAIQGEYALDATETEWLELEVTHKWRVPKMLYMTIITCSIGAAVQGWDQEGSNGANLSFPKQFGIGDPNADRDTFLVGLINSAPYIGSALIGCWCSDPLNNYFGRRGTIFISAIFCLLTPIGGALTQNWEQLLATRLLLGIGMGIKASTVPIFAAENSPAAIRGALVMTWQMWTAFGILLGVTANLVVGKVGDIAWRLQVGSAFIPAIPLTLLILFCPESPRWYMKKNRYKEALHSLVRLRNHKIQATRDLIAIDAQLQLEREAIGGSTYIRRFIELFTIPRVRRATLASFVVMIAQQMCGINIIAFYSSTVFKEAGTDDFNALLASFGFGLVNFIFAWPAIWTIDTFGRRSLLLFTFPNMAWTLLAAGLCTLIPGQGGAHVGLVALFVYLFAAFYSPGEGPVPFTYSAEVFPLSHREVGMAWAVSTCLFWAAVLSITFPKILASLHVIGAFCLYAGFNVVAFFMIWLWLPETKQRTLEELDYVFGLPTSKFIKYNVEVWLPWFIQRWVFFRKNAVLKPLYHFESGHTSSAEAIVKSDQGHTEYAETKEPTEVGDKSTSATGAETHPAAGDTKAL
ncbi:hypothetical protein JX265_003044 [Neoarthrinium moseri]|uniref:Major facilitator superfamily (MFS) profile domain-containing protein n=1 Tax=Neoarthrinium moseri TaxID=1658444 RepID=A0A9P9WT41_9PEZI|nr:hypothetical protein JX265_003044 [Neoarthrinium moseri]